MFKLNNKYTVSTSVETLLVSSKEDTKRDMKYISLVLLFVKFSRFLSGGLVLNEIETPNKCICFPFHL